MSAREARMHDTSVKVRLKNKTKQNTNNNNNKKNPAISCYSSCSATGISWINLGRQGSIFS